MASARTDRPGAFTLTWLQVRDPAEAAEVDLLSVEIVKGCGLRGLPRGRHVRRRRPQVHPRRLRPARVGAGRARPPAPAGGAQVLQGRALRPCPHQRPDPRGHPRVRPLRRLRRRGQARRRRGLRLRVDTRRRPPTVTGATMTDFTFEHAPGDGDRPAVVFMSALFAGGWIWEHPYRRAGGGGVPVLRTHEAICALDRRVAGSIERLGDALLRGLRRGRRAGRDRVRQLARRARRDRPRRASPRPGARHRGQRRPRPHPRPRRRPQLRPAGQRAAGRHGVRRPDDGRALPRRGAVLHPGADGRRRRHAAGARGDGQHGPQHQGHPPLPGQARAGQGALPVRVRVGPARPDDPVGPGWTCSPTTPGPRSSLVADSGHIPMIERAAEYTAILESFLDRHGRVPA